MIVYHCLFPAPRFAFRPVPQALLTTLPQQHPLSFKVFSQPSIPTTQFAAASLVHPFFSSTDPGEASFLTLSGIPIRIQSP